MIISYWVYIVTDTHGNRDASVCNEPSEGIQICGMKDEDGNSLYFESDAYHLEKWCADNGLKYNVMDRELKI